MEYRTPYLMILGLLVIVFWTMNYWSLLKKPELKLYIKEKANNIMLTKIFLYIVGLIGWGLISFSLMGPRMPLSFSPSQIEVNDILLVLDVSRSMLAEDLRPNRLENAKQRLREFAALKPTDRIGIIIFSEKVFTILPLTTDPSLIDQVISDIRIGYLGSGTNIGDALGLAVARAQNSETKNKVVVLLTDGVNNVGNMTPIDAAKLAKKFNIKVYTIGLGADKNAKLPIGRGAFGMRYQNMPGGGIDMKTLNEISDLTGGKTYRAKDENSFKKILHDINELEKTKIDSKSQIIYDEVYYKYLLWGLMILFLHLGLKRFYLKEVL